LVEQRTPQGRDLRVADMADEFVRSLRQELDFPLEAANAIALGATTDPVGGVRVPFIYAEMSTPRVLVQERLRGGTVGDAERIKASGIEPVELADRLVRTMVQAMFVTGHFHADPHPGNVFLLDDGDLGLIDFGATGRLDPAQRSALLQMMIAAANGDGAGLRESIESVAEVRGDIGDLALERALARFMSENLGPTRNVSRAFKDLVPMLATFDIRLPSELTVFFRTLVLLDGTARTICPGYSLVDAMQRLPDPAALIAPDGASMQDQLVQELVQQLPRLRRLPAHVDRIATLAARGDLHARIALFSTEADARVVTTLVNRVVLVATGGLLALSSAILLAASGAGGSSGSVPLTRVFGFIGLGVGAVLLLRVVASVVRDGYN
jgi:ubiquinone biosynthesis protein